MWKQKLRAKRQSRRTRPSYRRQSPIKTHRKLSSVRLARLAKIGLIASIALVILVIVAIPVLSFTLPSPDEIIRRDGFSTKILDRNGEVLYDIFTDQRRTPVELSNVPQDLINATIATEDKNFFNHSGYDPTAYPRALFNIAFKGKLQGGSTLTQQLVKNTLLSPERTITRKLKEFILAVQIESRFNKNEILQMYLNEAPYGGTAWGVESAAEIYFGKTTQELNLLESAFLAGLPQRPSVYSPYSNTPEAWKDRTRVVLRRLREDGHITKEQEETELGNIDSLVFQPRGASFKAPHFVQYVQQILEERYGELLVQQGGLQVTTTLDLALQEKAQEIVAEEIEKVQNLKIGNGAAVALDPETGEILAMVGSKDFNNEEDDGQVNVTLSQRQPGSAIKPIVYARGLQEGYTASTLFMDVPTQFPGGISQPVYEPVNYDGEFRGPIQMRFALANSVNVPAVKMLALVGISDTLNLAFDMGLTTLEPTRQTLDRVGLSLALGGGEIRLIDLTSAYAVFLNEGHRAEPVSILQVVDKEGKILEENNPKKGKRVISAEIAYIIADILSDNNARSDVFGTNSLLNIPGHKIAVKTGTTNDKKDNWTVGGNSRIVVGVWVGNNDNSSMLQVASGITGASPIWRGIILEALNDLPTTTPKRPEGLVSAEVDAVSGFASHDGFPTREEIFIRGTEPREDAVHLKLKVCKQDGKLATPSQVSGNDFDEKEFFAFKEEDPLSNQNEANKWQEGILAWLSTQADKYPQPPTEFCEGGNASPLNVEFDSPKDKDSNLDNVVEISFTINAINGVEDARLELDGVAIRSFTSPPYAHELDIADGPHELRIIAKDKNGNESDKTIKIGVNSEWDE